ncbi:G-type lectin S-receptor-like serine/threonine-protein kinase At1g11300 isoform X1 [Vigna radiata var. radiata]|uniref:Receptor-like serine/threonine-protein kinase n=2 Tax=Vigna radiata var. radiata TaxID=3916 RepID=A0A1S3VJJ8_VIGRR|nr:G-type lectin S-receptor-like serine/threonine-protein kinase At1g11300 isoform X1 [Vigna radiata var. radiata]
MGLTSSTLTSFTSFLCLYVFCVNAVTYKEILQTGQSLGTSDSVVSDSGKFELCFFNRVRDNSTKYYVGIRYKRVPNDKNKIVWVANRDYALETSSAVLTFEPDGNFVIMDGQVTYRVNKVSNNFSIYAMLLDSGNLILLKTSNKQILWQSFDHPTDTLLPGMKLGHDEGNTWSLRSWTSADDPAPGAFSLEYNLGRVSLIINNGSNAFWIDDHYNDTIGNFIRRSGVSMDSYFTLPVGNDSRLVLEVSGELNQEYWSDEQQHWVSIQSSKCANNSCGAFSICNPKARDPCDCLYGFRPSDADSWNNGNKSAGCVRNKDLSSCSIGAESNNDKFKQLYNVKSPTLDSLRTINTTKECESTCSRNCSCLAFAYYLNGDCQLWLGSVLNLKNVSTDVDNSDNSNPIFYLRLAASELDDSGSNKTRAKEPGYTVNKNVLLLIVILISFLAFLILGILVYWIRKKRRKGEDLLHFDISMSMKVEDSELTESDRSAKVKKEVKLPLFSFESVAAATDNFSDANKLGEGGFGPVYKGTLFNGDEVAVKRLSRRSGQGWEELRNEALLIAKLQHNNLVRLLGCCIDRNEKMLIYEFMPNKSLDLFLFDATKKQMLDWGTRVRIIDGIAQGILYLHQYSRFRIIHRDLKASNILLDSHMNPKISDFGLAKIFGDNELQANTNRIVGTYGYMAPEYAIEGLFSVKSDVFSFGVLLLEIVSGKKNTGFYQTSSFNLLGYAWDLWTRNSGLDLMDSALDDSDTLSNNSMHTVPRYVNIGLLCVQESPEDRPTMSDVVSMIGNDTVPLPSPKPPAFLNVRGDHSSSLPSTSTERFSVNVITDTILEAR